MESKAGFFLGSNCLVGTTVSTDLFWVGKSHGNFPREGDSWP